MLRCQHHRGPDQQGIYTAPNGMAMLMHNRLSILDLSEAGRQPMLSHSGRFAMVFNGEIYNYIELRRTMPDVQWRTGTDSEVLLEGWARWGIDFMQQCIGMFAFAIWDNVQNELHAVRDRLGIKPFNYAALPCNGEFAFASEIKTLFAAGVPAVPNRTAWAEYLMTGRYDHNSETFWQNIRKLQPGHYLKVSAAGDLTESQWYNLPEVSGIEYDQRPMETVMEEYLGLLEDSIRLRFRADVPVGINISGGLDSSALLAMVGQVQGKEASVNAFTFTTGNPDYDELPWVEQMIAQTKHNLIECRLSAEEIPALALDVQRHQDEPYGGFPTIAYARIFEEARRRGVIVLLDGQGMDEQWAGYDYYRRKEGPAPVVQGSTDSPLRPDAVSQELRSLATAEAIWPSPFPDRLRNLQFRDTYVTKIPRALRFNDRVSMRSSTELREPFMDHRLFELAWRQPEDRKIHGETGKYFMRRLLAEKLPSKVVQAPKRALQTPQREWLAGPLRPWAEELLSQAPHALGGGMVDAPAIAHHWQRFLSGQSDNSFYIWQWLSLSLMDQVQTQYSPFINQSAAAATK